MAHQRLDAFLKWIGWTDSELARRIPCHQTYARSVRRGDKRAGLPFAVAVEKLTTEFPWPEGPIRAAEWVASDAPTAAPTPEPPVCGHADTQPVDRPPPRAA